MQGISGETMAALSFGLQVVQVLLLPVVYGLARFLWKVDRRLLAIELKLGMHKRVGSDDA